MTTSAPSSACRRCPEDQGDPAQLTTPDGEVLPADKAGLDRWHAAWAAYCGRTDIEASYILSRLSAADRTAKGVFAGKPKICEWIEGFVADMREKVVGAT